jgi:hypothetical protein
MTDGKPGMEATVAGFARDAGDALLLLVDGDKPKA